MKRCATILSFVAIVIALLCSHPPRTLAYHPYITWPVLVSGTRGYDVQALQRLLTASGYSLTIDGIFGPTTDVAVKAFQSKNGLIADGMVGASTWTKLAVSVQSGATGQAVCALQEQLTIKHNMGLTTDCSFGAATASAMRDFQYHMGIPVTGAADGATWMHLIGHFENLSRTGVSGYGWYHYYDDGANAWGTANTIAQLKRVAQQWYDAGYRPRIQIGNISLPHGGDFEPHASHKRGIDADVSLIRNDGIESGVCYTSAQYSRALTQKLIDMARATGMVDIIFFNDPNVKGVTYAYGHDCHIHIRFKY